MKRFDSILFPAIEESKCQKAFKLHRGIPLIIIALFHYKSHLIPNISYFHLEAIF